MRLDFHSPVNKNKFHSKLREGAIFPFTMGSCVAGDGLASASIHKHSLEALCASGHQAVMPD